jgi:hypothetical protein
MQNGYSGNAIFGSPFWPADGTWNALNPLNRASRLQGVSVALYAGGGSNDQDVLEGTMRASADRFKAALDAAGVPAFYWMYGRPGNGCDGGHNFGCWNFALADAVPRMMAVLQAPNTPPPPAGVVNGGFESAGLAPWACTGNCGADHGAGLARTGTGNGWVRNNTGWNDVHETIAVQANHTSRSPPGCGRRPTTTPATSGCARPAARCSARRASAGSTRTRSSLRP